MSDFAWCAKRSHVEFQKFCGGTCDENFMDSCSSGWRRNFPDGSTEEQLSMKFSSQVPPQNFMDSCSSGWRRNFPDGSTVGAPLVSGRVRSVPTFDPGWITDEGPAGESAWVDLHGRE